jgi:1-acyl-sn-glycerol-3-phosphate acyltransferase
MDRRAKWSLLIQQSVGRIAVFLVVPLTCLVLRLMGYRIRELRRIRRECLRYFEEHKGPWLVCANHLTLIDSFILGWAMISPFRYVADYRLLPWNLPEQKNFNRNFLDTIFCYLAKCVPVNRGGDRTAMKRALEKCDYLLEKGQVLMVFPEGGRSRTGRVDTENFSYGVGRFVQTFEDLKIMCIYIRGDGQDTYSSFPRLGECFTVSVDVFTPERLEKNGLRAQRDYATQIIRRLSHMEEQYYAHRQRHSGFNRPSKQGKEPGCAVYRPDFHAR